MLIHLPIDPRFHGLSYFTKVCSCSAHEATNASRYYNICIKINKRRDISVDILWLRVKCVMHSETVTSSSLFVNTLAKLIRG